MTTRIFGVLSVLGALLLSWGAPSTVHANCPVIYWGVHCDGSGFMPNPVYGPIARGTQIGTNHDARFINYSPLTKQFTPITDWMPLLEDAQIKLSNVRATDGIVAYFNGYGKVGTLYGAASWGTQLVVNSDASTARGRWGIYNFDTHTFYPDATGWESFQDLIPYSSER